MPQPSVLLPEWTRVAWVSAEAERVWAPRVRAISNWWPRLERFATLERLAGRRAALQNVSAEELPALVSWNAYHGLSTLPLGQVGCPGTYSAGPQPVIAGQPWTYRVAIVHQRGEIEWLEAWKRGDDDALGDLLGFPSCCRRFFQRVWIDKQRVDTTWAMVEGSISPLVINDCPRVNNILLRWLGVRLVPHLPCQFDCSATQRLGERYLELAKSTEGFRLEAQWAEEMLQWPVEWSALHGIAEIVTPVCKVSTRTDWTASKLVVQAKGQTYPREGAIGTRFPFRPQTQVVPLTRRKAFEEAFAHGR
jgi:hypothetical protein